MAFSYLVLFALNLIRRRVRGWSTRKNVKNQRENESDKKICQSNHYCKEWQAGAAGHSNPGHKPNGSGCRQASDSILTYENNTGSDETDSRHNLRRDSGRIKNNRSGRSTHP